LLNVNAILVLKYYGRSDRRSDEHHTLDTLRISRVDAIYWDTIENYRGFLGLFVHNASLDRFIYKQDVIITVSFIRTFAVIYIKTIVAA